MVMLYLFPIACLATLVACVLEAVRARSLSGMRTRSAFVLVGLILSYCIALVVLSFNPWFDDNGAREFLAWRYRWAWAAELAGWLALLVVPAMWGLYALLRAGRG